VSTEHTDKAAAWERFALHHIAFFGDPMFEGSNPILAAAFHVSGVEYRWERGVRYSINSIGGLTS
jgi:hypothetical protein